MKLIAYLHFAGQCEEALNFYQEVLGGEILQVSRFGEGPMEVNPAVKNSIMHARLKLGDSVLYMSDGFKSGEMMQGNNVSLSLDIDDVSKIDNLFNKLAEGGTVKLPVGDMFWGARFGMLIDKFGIHWMMNCELSERTPSEKKEPALN